MKTFALNIELPGGGAPERIELIPAGPAVVGRDGRTWMFGDAEVQAVLNAFALNTAPLPIDWEHATELRAPKGEAAPAAGWITGLEMQSGALWGSVEWTDRGRAQVENREYRFLSPVFYYSKDRRIQALDSAGLTNKPNLRLTALNRQATMEDENMKKALCRLLGLPETATDQEVEQAVSTLQADLKTAQNRAIPAELSTVLGLDPASGPDQTVVAVKALNAQVKSLNSTKTAGSMLDLTAFVPRADYDLALNRAETVESKLKTLETTAREKRVEVAVNKALAEGKIAPASKAYYTSMCRKDGGLEEFEKFAAAAPQLIRDPQLPDAPEKKTGTLSTEQIAICHSLGLDKTEFAKSLKEGA